MSSIFDEMRDILNEINTKLGANAGDAAKVLNLPPKEPKKEEDFLKNRSEFASSIRDTFNNIPVLNKLLNTLSGLNPILRELVSGGALLAASSLLKKSITIHEQALNTAIKKSIPDKTILDQNIPYEQAKLIYNVSQRIEDKLKLTQMTAKPNKFGLDDWQLVGNNLKVLTGNIRDKLGETLLRLDRMFNIPAMSRYEGLRTLLLGKPSNAARQTVTGEITGGYTGMLEGTNLTGLSMLRLLAVPGILIATGAALTVFAKHLVDADRSISMFNPGTATAWTLSDINDMLRNMTSAFRRGPAEQDFIAEWTRLKDAWRPIIDEVTVGLIKLGIALAGLVARILELLNKLGIPEGIKFITEGNIGPAPFIKPRMEEQEQLMHYRAQMDIGSQRILATHDKAKLAAWIETLNITKRDWEKELKQVRTDEAFTGEPWFGPSRTSIQEKNLEDINLKIKYLESIQKKWEAGQKVDIKPLQQTMLDKPATEDSPIVRLLQSINKNLQELKKAYEQTKNKGEVVDVGNFMAGVVNDPRVYNPDKDRAFDYTNQWNIWRKQVQ